MVRTLIDTALACESISRRRKCAMGAAGRSRTDNPNNVHRAARIPYAPNTSATPSLRVTPSQAMLKASRHEYVAMTTKTCLQASKPTTALQ
jgi:hypothetical protein